MLANRTLNQRDEEPGMAFKVSWTTADGQIQTEDLANAKLAADRLFELLRLGSHDAIVEDSDNRRYDHAQLLALANNLPPALHALPPIVSSR